MKDSYSIITHSGGFHLDDIFAVATILLHHGEQGNIIRSRDPEIIERGDVVVDVGRVYDPVRCRFDHHQHMENGIRENGIPYAAFGLVWKEYGESVCNSEYIARNIEERLVYPIDALDNGVEISPQHAGSAPFMRSPQLHDIVHLLHPTWNEPDTLDEQFEIAVKLAVWYLKRLIVVSSHASLARQKVLEAYEQARDKRIIILDDKYPFYEALAPYDEPLYVIYPDTKERALWGIKGVRKNPAHFEVKKPLPEAWAGKEGYELQSISQVEGAQFAHKGRFFATASSLESAVSLVNKALAE